MYRSRSRHRRGLFPYYGRSAYHLRNLSKDGSPFVKVLHLSPTYFDPQSVVGGGERYAYELARAMSRKTDTTFASFSEKTSQRQEGNLRVELIRKNRPSRFLKLIAWADIIHCHQVFTVMTDWALLLGNLFKKKVFVTDSGGADRFALSYHLPILRRANAFLLLSQYSKTLWEKKGKKFRPSKILYLFFG